MQTGTETMPGLERMMGIIRETMKKGEKEKGQESWEERKKPVRDFAEQRRRMERRLRAEMEKLLLGWDRHRFVLNEGQIQTLQGLELPEKTCRDILSLNLMPMETMHHQVNDRLETIMALPPTPEEMESPDWETWWLDQRTSHIGVARPQDHDPLRDTVEEYPNSVIRAMMERAVLHIPTPERIAQDLMERGKKNTSTNRRSTPDRASRQRANLTDVWESICQMRYLAFRIGTPQETLERMEPSSPEELLEMLKEKETPVRQDGGTITGLEELRRTMRENNVSRIEASGWSRRWQDRDNNNRSILRKGPGISNGENQIVEQRLWPQGENPSPEEERLVRLTAPEHPGHPQHPIWLSQEAAVGFINQVTPRAVREYLQGISDDPEPEPPDPCPLAGSCISWCSHLQRTGEHPFPLTDGGTFQECEYYQFLHRYGHLEGETRREAALLESRKALKRMEPVGKRDESPGTEIDDRRENNTPSGDAQIVRKEESEEENGAGEETKQGILF